MKSTDAGLTDVDYTEDVEKPDRTTGVGTERSWMNPSLKLHVRDTTRLIFFLDIQLFDCYICFDSRPFNSLV